MEVRLEDRLEHQHETGLDHPVGHGRDPQRPDLPGDFGISRCRTGEGMNAA